MDFIEKIQALSQKIAKEKDHIQTEEATKTAFVLPFINALGYDIFNPREVIPEFTADIGTKKGEKVDYAIMKDDVPIMLFECKSCGCDLNNVHKDQLLRYFSVKRDKKIGVLTNGMLYRFFSDFEKEKAAPMDEKPFFEFNLADFDESLVEQLKKLSKSAFVLNEVLETGLQLKYTREIRQYLEEQLTKPSEPFVRLLGSQLHLGSITQKRIPQFVDITQRALKQFINDQINKRLKSALNVEPPEQQPDQKEEGAVTSTSNERDDTKIETTMEELEGYYIVKSLLREVAKPNQVIGKDKAGYFLITLGDTTWKPICRFYFDKSKKRIGLFDNKEKKEERILIDKPDDIYNYADRLKNTIAFYPTK